MANAGVELPSPHTCKAAARRLPFCCLLFARCLSLVAFFFDAFSKVSSASYIAGSRCHSAVCCCKAKTRLGRCYAMSGCLKQVYRSPGQAWTNDVVSETLQFGRTPGAKLCHKFLRSYTVACCWLFKYILIVVGLCVITY